MDLLFLRHAEAEDADLAAALLPSLAAARTNPGLAVMAACCC